MDWSLIIFIIALAFFTYRGYKKGLLKSLSRVLSLITGYVAAILYAGDVSTLVESNTPLQGITAFVAASLMLFQDDVNFLTWLDLASLLMGLHSSP